MKFKLLSIKPIQFAIINIFEELNNKNKKIFIIRRLSIHHSPTLLSIKSDKKGPPEWRALKKSSR